MAMDPIRPFISEDRDELIRTVKQLGLLTNLLPKLRVCRQGLHSPVIVIGQGHHIQTGDIASVAKIVLGCAGTVRQTRVTVQIRPQDSGRVGIYHHRVALPGQLFSAGTHNPYHLGTRGPDPQRSGACVPVTELQQSWQVEAGRAR